MAIIERYIDELMELLNETPDVRRDRDAVRRFVASVWVAGASYDTLPVVYVRNQAALLRAVEFLLTAYVDVSAVDRRATADELLAAIRDARARVKA